MLVKVPKKPKVVWTYMELGLDACGQSDDRRRVILQRMISYLGWSGSVAFWAMSSLVNGTLQPNKDIFWKGWELWRTPEIVCFGEEAAHVILPDFESGKTTYLFEHVTVNVLPPMSKLTKMLPHEIQIALDPLKSLRF